MKKIHLSRLAALSSACALSVLTLNSSAAQQANAGAGQGAQTLPPVVISQPQVRRAAAAAPKRAARAPRSSAAASRRPPVERAALFVENPRGAIRGYVAGRSMAGTKTNTAINENPQSVSVIGAEQISRPEAEEVR
ncbi:hypothetical protein [Rhodopseudomonas sp. RCAM05734]|uniref:hypothetical protein n=1 Tax=Rhodopseudomonas sp. RCAM05734 TaxID=3457549 RepID=UPI004043D935